MGIWSSLLRWIKPIRIVDPMFGPLRFHGRKQPQSSYWEGGWQPPWQQGEAELKVIADQSGPDQEQRRRWGTFLEHVATFRSELERELYDDYLRWVEIVREHPNSGGSPFPQVGNSAEVWKHSFTATIEVLSSADKHAPECDLIMTVEVDWEEEHFRCVSGASGRLIEFVEG